MQGYWFQVNYIKNISAFFPEFMLRIKIISKHSEICGRYIVCVSRRTGRKDNLKSEIGKYIYARHFVMRSFGRKSDAIFSAFMEDCRENR